MATYINITKMAEELGLSEEDILTSLTGYAVVPKDDFEVVKENCRRSVRGSTVDTSQDFGYAAGWFVEQH